MAKKKKGEKMDYIINLFFSEEMLSEVQKRYHIIYQASMSGGCDNIENLLRENDFNADTYLPKEDLAADDHHESLIPILFLDKKDECMEAISKCRRNFICGCNLNFTSRKLTIYPEGKGIDEDLYDFIAEKSPYLICAEVMEDDEDDADLEEDW